MSAGVFNRTSSQPADEPEQNHLRNTGSGQHVQSLDTSPGKTPENTPKVRFVDTCIMNDTHLMNLWVTFWIEFELDMKFLNPNS